MEHESILAHLAPLLTSQIENVATDALAHLLLKYQFLADEFQKYLLSAGFELPDNLVFKAQASWQDNAIPDLVGCDENGRFLLIIESKFWAPLTPNQPNTYLDGLPTDSTAMLLFIAPASRIPTLWEKLLKLSKLSPSSGRSRQEIIINEQFITLRLKRNHILALTSWERLLDVFYNRAVKARNKYATGDIWQLQSLCARIDIDENTSPTKMKIGEFRGLIDELVSHLEELGIVSTEKYRATPGVGYFKRYISINEFVDWCIEFNDEYSKKYPPTNLWLTTRETPQLAALLPEFTPVKCRSGRQFLIPLEIPMDVERDDVLSSLVQQVKGISNRIITTRHN